MGSGLCKEDKALHVGLGVLEDGDELSPSEFVGLLLSGDAAFANGCLNVHVTDLLGRHPL